MEEFTRTHCTRVATTIRWSESRRRERRERNGGVEEGGRGRGVEGGKRG